MILEYQHCFVQYKWISSVNELNYFNGTTPRIKAVRQQIVTELMLCFRYKNQLNYKTDFFKISPNTSVKQRSHINCYKDSKFQFQLHCR